MKKYLKIVMFFVFYGFLFSLISLQANSTPVEALEGASIRVAVGSSEQGLRFYAKLDENVKNNNHGFYLVYGQATLVELKGVIADESLILNEKAVFHVSISGVNIENEFSVVLTGIPTKGYFDKISVFSYVEVGGEKVFADAHVSRSVGEVALNMARAGSPIESLLGDIEDAYIKGKLDDNNNYELSLGVEVAEEYIDANDYDFYLKAEDIELPLIAKAGYSFGGWYLNEGLLYDYVTEIKKENFQPMTLYSFYYSNQTEDYSGNVLKIAYKNGTSLGATTAADAVYLQDPQTGKIFIVTGLESAVASKTVKEGAEIEFKGLMKKDSFGRISIEYQSDINVLQQSATLLDYKDYAITVNSHAELVEYLSKDFHFGQVYRLKQPFYFNSTTGSGDVTHIRYHLNPNASLLNDIRYGEENIAVTFNVVTHQQIYGQDFTLDYFALDENPGTKYPGIEVLDDLYVVFKDYSGTYYFTVLLNGEDLTAYKQSQVAKEIDEVVLNKVFFGNLSLPSTSDYIDDGIVWSSSNKPAISDSGVVNYAYNGETVTMTATYSVNNKQFTKEVEVLIDATIIEVEDALLAEDEELVFVVGYALQVGYTNTTSAVSSSKLNEIFLQDRNTGRLVIVEGLAALYGEQFNLGDEIQFVGKVLIDEAKLIIDYIEGFEVLSDAVALLDYQETAIEIDSHYCALEEFSKDFHFGEVYHFTGPVYFNSTTSSGRMTNLRFHLNKDAEKIADLRVGGKSLVLNINGNEEILGEGFAEDLFDITGNPFVNYPGEKRYVDFYFVIKDFSNDYYYAVILAVNDVFEYPAEMIVEVDAKELIPTEIMEGTIDLLAAHTLVDAGISWASNKEDVIGDDGKVYSVEEDTLVTLTATFEIASDEYSFTVEVTVKPLVPMGVSETIAEASNGDLVFIEGIVVGFHWDGSSTLGSDTNGVILKDPTGNEILYVIGLYSNYGSNRFVYTVNGQTIAKGDKVKFFATYEVSMTTGHAGRKTLVISDATTAKLAIVSRENSYSFALDEAIEVSSQDDLENVAENLPYGTLFKITGDFGFRGSASNYGTAVNLQTSYVRTKAADYDMPASWADRGQRFSFKFDGNAPNLGTGWQETLLGINSTTYTGTTASGMSFEEGAYIYFYIGHTLPKAATANGYIQLIILDPSWIRATLKIN